MTKDHILESPNDFLPVPLLGYLGYLSPMCSGGHKRSVSLAVAAAILLTSPEARESTIWLDVQTQSRPEPFLFADQVEHESARLISPQGLVLSSLDGPFMTQSASKGCKKPYLPYLCLWLLLASSSGALSLCCRPAYG